MSAFDDGLRRLHEISDEVVGSRVRDERRREYGTLTSATPTGFTVRFPIEGRDLPYPYDAFAAGVLRFDFPTEMRLRETILALGRSERAAAKAGVQRLPSLRPAAPAPTPAAAPPPVEPTPAPQSAPMDDFTRDVMTVLSPPPYGTDESVAALVGVAVTPKDTPLNREKGNVGARGGSPKPGRIDGVRWVPLPTKPRGMTPTEWEQKVAEYEAGDVYLRWSIRIRTDGVPGWTPVSEDTLLANFTLNARATPAATVAAIRARAEQIRLEISRRQEAGRTTRAGYEAPEETRARLTATRAPAAITPVFGTTMEAEIMSMVQARPVAVTFAVAGQAPILDKAKFSDIGKTVNTVIRLLREQYPKFEESYRLDRAAWEAAGSRGKAPIFPWSILILEMSNGSRVQIDLRTGLAYDPPRTSEEVTRRLEALLTLPKVGPTRPDTRAANEMRENLRRMGATEYGPGGRQYGSEALLREVRDAEFSATPGPLLRAADPGIEGQTRTGADLYRYRGKSKFQRMVEATPITETAETRLARAKEFGEVSDEELRDIIEGLAIATGERITASAAETTFRRQIKLKEGENPDGRYVRIAPGEFMVLGTTRIFSEPRAQAFIRQLGLEPQRVRMSSLGGAAVEAAEDFPTPVVPRTSSLPSLRPVPVEEEEQEESASSAVIGTANITREIIDLNPEVLFLVPGRATARGVEPLAKELADRPNVVPIPLKGGKRAFTDADAEKSLPLISTAFAYPASVLSVERTFPSSMRSTIVVIPEDVFGKHGAELKKSAPQTYAYVEQQLEALESGDSVYPRAARWSASEGDFYVLVKSADVQRARDGSEYYIFTSGMGAPVDQITFPEDFDDKRDWAAMLDYFVRASTAP
jgi:hypothetical protein